jgi:hypothetical protein
MHDGTGELAQRRLQGSPYLALRELGCAYHDGVLTLWGSLPSHYLKQVAQTMVGDVAGVTTLVNTIAVVPPRRRASGPRGGAALKEEPVSAETAGVGPSSARISTNSHSPGDSSHRGDHCQPFGKLG